MLGRQGCNLKLSKRQSQARFSLFLSFFFFSFPPTLNPLLADGSVASSGPSASPPYSISGEQKSEGGAARGVRSTRTPCMSGLPARKVREGLTEPRCPRGPWGYGKGRGGSEQKNSPSCGPNREMPSLAIVTAVLCSNMAIFHVQPPPSPPLLPPLLSLSFPPLTFRWVIAPRNK